MKKSRQIQSFRHETSREAVSIRGDRVERSDLPRRVIGGIVSDVHVDWERFSCNLPAPLCDLRAHAWTA